jgi:hypothetical protein
MKKLTLLLVAIVGLSSCEMLNPFGNEGDHKEKAKVIGEWTFEKSETDGVVHYPTAEEQGDKVVLRVDDSFTCVEKGGEVSGNWDFRSNRRGNVISLMENGNAECILYRVESVDENQLVYSIKNENTSGQQSQGQQGNCGPRTIVTMVSATPNPATEE